MRDSVSMRLGAAVSEYEKKPGIIGEDFPRKGGEIKNRSVDE